MKRYRLPFYEELYRRLSKTGVDLTVAYSEPKGKEIDKADNCNLPKHYGKPVKLVSILNGKMRYQQCLSDIVKADLVIVEQANKHLVNYLLILLSAVKLKRFALWGHGKNYQADSFNKKEKIKKLLLTQADWWFAYTNETARYVKSCGFPQQQITNVENSIDVRQLNEDIQSVKPEEIRDFKKKHGIPNDAIIGLFCGAMYEEKQLPFLCECLIKIQEKDKRFYFIFAGAGTDGSVAANFCRQNPWACYVGPVFDTEKALCFATADLVLNPGLVGLGILDCFAAGTPMVTTRYPKHSPEIAYISNGENGIVSDFTISSFSQAVIFTLKQKDLLSMLQVNAKLAAQNYSVENMARNFAQGVQEALHQ